MTSGNMMVTLFIYGSKGQQVKIHTSCYQDGINVEVSDGPGVTMFNQQYFADVITALVMGVDHVPGLPAYCQCETCRNERGKALAARIAAAQAERLAKEEHSDGQTSNEG